MTLRDRHGVTLATESAALGQAARAVRGGRIMALEGPGGFLLVVDARNAEAVARLRNRKQHYEKPLALMVPDVAVAKALCFLPEAAEDLLRSPEAPILLLERRPNAPVATGVAPGSPDLGVMLPRASLHRLLMEEVGFPVVATSGNPSGEPIATSDREAIGRLSGIADSFLVQDRPIDRPADDSVVRLLEGAPQVLRRARGFAALPVVLERPVPTLLAVGARLENTVGLAVGERVFVSRHLGDMETLDAQAGFERTIRNALDRHAAVPEAIVHDLHPDYPSSRWARAVGCELRDLWPELADAQLIGVQHHHAHLASCLAEGSVRGPALGVTWDGAGYGTDGSVWGGEMLHGDATSFRRVARLRPFRLPGGEAAVKQPRRSALALLWELEGENALERGDLAPVAAFTSFERRVLGRMLSGGFQAPKTTSAGRLFDAVASLLGLHQRIHFEGQAAMALEAIADRATDDAYPLPLRAAGEAGLELDWRPLIEAILESCRRKEALELVSARFHNALAAAIVRVARRIGEPRVALTGGCFQNRLLSERAARLLRRAGFEVLHQRQMPPGDGGISLGQIAVAAARLSANGEV